MKKWLKWLILPACLFIVSPVWGQSMAHDTSRGMSYYSTYGWSGGAVVKDAIDRSALPESLVAHILNSAGVERNQLQRHVVTIPLSSQAVVDTITDSLWTHLLTVPTGKTVTLNSASISARIELDMAHSRKTSTLAVFWYDLSGTTLDTIVAWKHIDKDSCAYNNAALALTMLDSSFAVGDIIWAVIYNDSTVNVAPEGLGITLEYVLDE